MKELQARRARVEGGSRHQGGSGLCLHPPEQALLLVLYPSGPALGQGINTRALYPGAAPRAKVQEDAGNSARNCGDQWRQSQRLMAIGAAGKLSRGQSRVMVRAGVGFGCL